MYVRGLGVIVLYCQLNVLFLFFYIRLNAKYVFLYYMIYILQLKYC